LEGWKRDRRKCRHKGDWTGSIGQLRGNQYCQVKKIKGHVALWEREVCKLHKPIRKDGWKEQTRNIGNTRELTNLRMSALFHY
jgi:hypothetical protein